MRNASADNESKVVRDPNVVPHPSSSTRRLAQPLGITFFRLVAEHGSDVASLHSRNGDCAFAAASWERTFGWDARDLTGRSLLEFVHPEDLATVTAALAVEGDATGRATYRLRTPAGRYVWVETLTQATPPPGEHLVVCMTRDVSPQRRAQTALEEGMLALALRSPDVVLVVQGGEIRRVNPAAVDALRVASVAALEGRAVADLVHGDGTELADAMRDLAPSSSAPLRDVQLVAADGQVVSSEGYVLGISFEGRDAALVVLRRRARPDTAAIVSDRLRSIGALAAGLAHEIADPMMLLLTSLEVLEDADADGAVRREALAQARQAGQRVFEGVQGLRAFSRGDEDLRRTLDARGVVDAVITVAQGRVASGTRIARDFAPEPVWVHADQARLSQAVLNLVSNAVDAANQRDLGEVRVVVRNAVKGGALIEIIDNGPGIDERVLERVFEPFFSTKPVAMASGLGLPISNAIISSLGGRLALESAVGAGTVAMVQLPKAKGIKLSDSFGPATTIRVSPAPAPPAHAQPMPRVSPREQRPKLLLLDDEPLLGTSMKRVLGNEYDVTVELRAEDALRRIIAGETYDVILCDLQLPGMSGIDFYLELQSLAPSLISRVVFVTGAVVTPGAQSFLDSRPNVRIDKPFLPSHLRARLRELLEAREGTSIVVR